MICLSEIQLNQIKAEAEAAYPAECCGLLIGQIEDATGTLSRIVPSKNIAPTQAHDRFEIDPQIRIDVERELRGSSECIIGHYHSHPDHPAMPSKTDLEMAFEPDLVWLILSVMDGKAQEFKAHRLDGSTQCFVEIECGVK